MYIIEHDQSLLFFNGATKEWCAFVEIGCCFETFDDANKAAVINNLTTYTIRPLK